MLDVSTSIAIIPCMKRQSNKLSDQIRQAIDDSGQTRYRIAEGAGIDESALAKFYNGKRGLSLNSLDKMASYLELYICKRNKKER